MNRTSQPPSVRFRIGCKASSCAIYHQSHVYHTSNIELESNVRRSLFLDDVFPISQRAEITTERLWVNVMLDNKIALDVEYKVIA